MNILVRRRWPDPKSLMGELLLDGKFECYTLEPPVKTDGSKPRAIPAGTYPLTIRFSPRFQRLMPHVENVPGFEEIEIHWGNFPKDTEGCTLLGSIMGTDFVGHSRDEFDKIYDQLHAAFEAGPQTITYTGVPRIAPDVDGEISV
jgi:hypothetical protein